MARARSPRRCACPVRVDEHPNCFAGLPVAFLTSARPAPLHLSPGVYPRAKTLGTASSHAPAGRRRLSRGLPRAWPAGAMVAPLRPSRAMGCGLCGQLPSEGERMPKGRVASCLQGATSPIAKAKALVRFVANAVPQLREWRALTSVHFRLGTCNLLYRIGQGPGSSRAERGAPASRSRLRCKRNPLFSHASLRVSAPVTPAA